MSFCANPGACTPGPISGNPLQSLAEKACIEVKKVFDAGLMQRQMTEIPVTLVNFMPANPVKPLTFVSAVSVGSKGTVSGVCVEPLGCDRRARVRCCIGIPMRVVYVDAAGVEGCADAVITLSADVVLCVPEASVIPYEVESVVSAIASNGVINDEIAILDCCITVILKLVIETELLIPSYGYCHIPPLVDFASDACAEFFELPLYP